MTKVIARRDQDIIRIGLETQELKEDIAQGKEIYDERLKQLEAQAKINREQEAQNVIANREISERKNENKTMEFEKIANLSAEV